jgi:chromosome segregation ATPase
MRKHARIINAVSKLRTEIADRVAEASIVAGDLADRNAQIDFLKGRLSELESQAADRGLSVSDLHKAVDEIKAASPAKKTSE